MSRHAFRDFDEFADSIDGIAGRFVPTKRSYADWWVQQVPAGKLSLQQVQIGGAATFAGDGQLGCLTLGIPMTHPRRIHIDGGLLDPCTILFLTQRQPFTFAAEDATLWAGITLPLQHFLLGHEQRWTQGSYASARASMRLADVERLRELTARLSSVDPSISIADPAAATAAEEEVAVCVARALEHCTPIRDIHEGKFYYSRPQVIGRTLALMEASDGVPLHIADLCKATGVSERTLRNIFNDYFGVSPMRMIKLRQLREIRAALAAGDPEHDTVAQIAQRFGIWDFSLFARNYKRIFSESPSQTLRMPPGRLGSRDNVSWLNCAARIFIEDTRPPIHFVEIPFTAPSVQRIGLSQARSHE